MASRIMMGYGGYRFSLDTAAYQNLVRQTTFGFSAVDRAANHPHQQRANLGTDSITLKGVIFGAFKGGIFQPEMMRLQGRQGVPLPLVSGYGHWLGMWVVTSLTEVQSVFFSDGAPRKQEFEMQLEYAG